MLAACTYTNTATFQLPPVVMCKVLDIYDADSVTVAVSLNGHDTDGATAPPARFSVRLIGIDTPERKPKKRGNPDLESLEKQAAMAAHAHLIQMLVPLPDDVDLAKHARKRKKVRAWCAQSTRLATLKFHGFDKYGRVLGELGDATHDFSRADSEETGTTVNQQLMLDGFARPYDGGTRQPWTREPLQRMLHADEDTVVVVVE
jgi:endonuclease YncB( thermonuclease family)